MTTFIELQEQIRKYTETDTTVLTDTIVNNFILQAELRIFREVDLDCFRAYEFATLTIGNETMKGILSRSRSLSLSLSSMTRIV